MGIKVSLEHSTRYSFDRLVRIHPHVVRLRPAPHTRTTIEAYSLRVAPAGHFVNWQQDAFGNFLARLVFPEPSRELEITVGLVADLDVINPFDFFVEEDAEHYPFTYAPEQAADLEAYLRPVDEDPDTESGPGPLVRDWVRRHALPSAADRPRTIDFLVELNRMLRDDVDYTVRMEPGVQTPDFTLRAALGSCRDSAWLLVSILRELGLAARFVSGYLVQLSQDAPSLDGPSGPVADFTDLHAWTEVFLPGAGWVGMDPTSGLFAGEGHIPLAATPQPSSSAPITGATDRCEATLEFTNTVRRIHEDPRVTLPYTDTEWQRITALGAVVDERSADIGLTIGGEPTFVSVDDQTSEQWTTAADGPEKRLRAVDLAARMRRIYAPTGLVQYRQGKWYPGEPLPRWEIAVAWRSDGEPVWTRQDLLADPWSTPDLRRVDHETGAAVHQQTNSAVEPAAGRSGGSAPAADTNGHLWQAKPDAAQALIADVAVALGLPESQVRPAYEDPLLRLATVLRTPVGEPVSEDLAPEEDSAQARSELLARADRSVTSATSYVLPLYRRADDGGWGSADWRFRRGRIVLADGDSPAGLRLPLDAVSWYPAPPQWERDPIVPGPIGLPRAEPAAVVEAADWVPTTALVAEVRDGRLFVFLPPLNSFEDFLEVVGRVEAAAVALNQPVVLEGYAPPPDPRLRTFSVTPDPGVIEVNVQPTSSFAEQARLLETLYEQARLARLGTETFDIDGTHSGTGGGNHLTLGGASPDRSPLLRRPDLLVSMLRLWQRHPALSYLFSGRFIGPTSQAPRVDEGRPEALYELEIAFAEIARLAARKQPGGGTGSDAVFSAPWEVDRALRHLLTDLTGNTHRAEFCIDKLYSPDSARGRLGLLELRGFEMPPHDRMAMVQSLLVRALVLRCWTEPYTAPLLRHGANLHGRYLLPHFVLADIAEVVADLRSHGIDFELSWLDPFAEFRFPRIGTVALGNIELELRSAIEPWHTLGEQTVATGTARYVDSSVERLQVRLAGADRDRYLLTCNGFPVPLLATDKADVQVAGVRYRAWQPPNALHPSITVDVPLVFDLVERGTGVSLGGCTYHVAHPGGMSYETPPVNAVAAQSRRNRRFEPIGHTPGRRDPADLRAKIAVQSVDVGAPGILDLRRARTVWGVTGGR
ncbi:DUF2126 domain-containing protein [Nocardia sp. BMG111209]|uniref:transglutaminase family protein n=1 Tax=Nocardia sp. BMG111209 TaxID=1160137 RepID=UPI000364DA8D|nr:transglutaminase family protein [Nocardia sp. BMG111209]